MYDRNLVSVSATETKIKSRYRFRGQNFFLPKLKLQDDTDTLASSDYNEETGFIWPSPQIKQTNNTGFLILLHSLSTYNKLWSKKGWREKEVMQNLPTFRQLRAIQQMSSLLALKWPT